MYPELYNCPIGIDFKPPVIPPLQDYKPIPDSILQSYPVNISQEELAIREYKEFTAYNERLKKAKVDAQASLENMRKKQEEERLLEMKRKAPGLSDAILQPTKSGLLATASDKKVLMIYKDEKDLSEFDQLGTVFPNEPSQVDFQMLKEIMSTGDSIEKKMDSMNISNTSSPIPYKHNMPAGRTNTPPSGSPTRLQNNYGSPIPNGYLSHSPNSNGSHRPNSQYSSPIPYSSPHNYGSPNQYFSGNSGYLSGYPLPNSPYRQEQAPPRPAKVKAYGSPAKSRDFFPREEPANHPSQSSKTEQFIQMGFNGQNVQRAIRLYKDEQEILDFLFCFEDLLRQGHDGDAIETVIQLVGITDKTSIHSILVNVPNLLEMGFNSADCVQALHKTKNDKEAALDLLLNKN